MYDKNLVHESDAITTTSTSDANHQHHKTTNIHNIYNVEKRSTSSASRQYLNQQLHDDDAHALSREQLQQLRQAYSMDELPRVTRLNDQEVQSVDSALLTADEQDLIDSSIEEERLSSAYRRSGSLSICRLFDRSVARSISQPVGSSIGRSVSRLVGQLVGRSVSRLVNWSVDRAASWSVSWGSLGQALFFTLHFIG